ncbi:alpha-1,4-glucan:maltose-1-phosphate maltosyltransferase [Actinoalloteichus fjordicus]|uniref:Alpha-1,4-glucan:maltose-1-phosphate maltosyltransferase n=1 Tax=Actinoalloteichus fjordicus TaxID=1612552 RepID=A0AAC9LA22_9PSEU|nr:alpha-1,4-glucan:maltose-1-phosphate maltosyltransferase [Actinoalloteichus fjordicus]
MVVSGRIVVEDVSPAIDEGRHPSKGVVGEHIPVHATVWREGHDAAAATIVWGRQGDRLSRRTRMRLANAGEDRWSGTVVPDEPGRWSFRVEGWSDPWSTWRAGIEAKLAAGQSAEELANDLEIGARLVDRAARRPDSAADRVVLRAAAIRLRQSGASPEERIALALSDAVVRVMTEQPVRDLVTSGRVHHIWVDRPRAAVGSWYEFFPRSTGGHDAEGRPVHGTWQTATTELDRIAAMGFDVVYLPPIHPIGHVHRKGRNNTLTPEPTDVGSPWAIGSPDGGHDTIHPDLGTLDDFDQFVARATELNLEVALDLALQCAPDHPWVRDHPEWFTTRPDGTIAYAENPPKKYQDIYPLNFDNDPTGLYQEIRRVVIHWIDHGIRIFRVDNPHTKPPDFWKHLIAELKTTHPDVLFLSEAFTKPARMYGLSRLGFTQHYTYFTWRTTKHELTEFGSDLVAHAHEARPNLFVNTPDILPAALQSGEPAMFALRAALAATLGPSWGVYAGYELYEHEPLRPGAEEYLDSEKFELRPRDHAAAVERGRSLEPWLTRLNEIRRAHPALGSLRTLHFHEVDNDDLIAFSKRDPASGDTVIVVVNLDPTAAQKGTVRLDLAALGLAAGAAEETRFTCHDEVSGEVFDWGTTNFVTLDPPRGVAHILSVGDR